MRDSLGGKLMGKFTTVRVLTILGIATAAAALLAIGGRIIVSSIAVPSASDTWVRRNAVILDSAQIQGSPIAYAFCYDIGAFGYSISMASVREPSHQPGFLVVRGNVDQVWWTAPDTLMVGVQSLNYELAAPPAGIVVEPTRSPKPRNRSTAAALNRVGECAQ
jgi:hypothetical protein